MSFFKKIIGQGGENKDVQLPVSALEVVKTEAPRNPLEQAVYDASPVVSTLKQTEAQLRADALHTMEIMEAARADRGNFCLTIGQGESRALLLVAPVEGNVYEAITPADHFRPEQTHRFTSTDYVILTANGPRRVGFKTHIDSSLYDARDKENALAEEKRAAAQFSAIIDESIRTGQVDLGGSVYAETETPTARRIYLVLRKPGSKSGEEGVSRNKEWWKDRPSGFDHTDQVDVVTDETVIERALSASLQKVQAPVNAQIASARAQIGAVNNLANGLK